MAIIAKDTLKELADYINEANLKAAVLIAHDSATGKWVILEADSTTGKLKVDTT